MSLPIVSRWIATSCALIALVCLTATLALAQVTTGSIQGVVTDPNKAVVPGATVKITNVDTGTTREATTNDEGFYRVTNLQPGEHYRVEVSKAGFSPAKVENLVVHIATENSADISFSQIAGASGTVTVTSEEQSLIQTNQNQLTTNYSQKQLTQLPFNGGLIDNLALLTPGIVTPGDADFTNGVGISANGNRGRSNNFQIDGQDNNDNSVAGPSLFLTNVDAIGEYQVITNNFSAEFGRNSGAQINVITKPGTNDIHGTGFEYYLGSALRSRDNLDKRAQAGYKFLASKGFNQFAGLANRSQDPFSRHRFGGSIGGPYKQNKAFYFFTFQRDRQTGEQTTNNFTSDFLVMTPQSVAAICGNPNFPIGCGILNNSGAGGGPTRAPGTLLIAPPTLDTNGDGVPDALVYGVGNPFGFTPTASSLAEIAFIRSGGTGAIIPLTAGEATRIARNEETEDQFITRNDFNLTNKDTLSLRYIYDKDRFPNGTPATGRFLAGAFFNVPSYNHNLGATYTRTISSSLVNEARFNFSRLFVTFGDTTTKPGPEISFAGTRTLSPFADLMLTFGTQNNLPQSRKVDVYQWQDTLSATRGNHALKLGADIRHQKVDNFFLPNFLGRYQFRGSTPTSTTQSANSGLIPAANLFFFGTAGTDRNGRRATAVENLLLGRPRQITFASGNPRILTTQNDYFFFIQDDWRVRPNLTLNLGLRYELSTTPFNPIIDAVNAREANSSTAIFDTAFPLSSRTASKLPIDKNNFGPRVGFAWSPEFKALGSRFSGGRTVIRGGIGIAYDPSYFNIVLNTVTAAPFAAAGILTQTPGGTGSVLFPFLPTTVAQLDGTPGTNGGDPRLFNQTRVSPDFHSPYTISWNFGLQTEVWKNTVIEARYVGSRIIGQFQTVTGNPDVQFLNQAAQCLGLPAGTFSGGAVVGSPAANAAAACGLSGFDNRPGTNGNGRLDPNFGAVRVRTNGATATYHGLQMRFDTRLSNSLVINANYTFSRTIDNASEIFSTGGGGQGVADPQMFFNSTSGERGLSAFDQKHSFSTNFIYDLPWNKGQKGAVGKLLGGYEISGTIFAGSGRPYQPLEAFGTYDPNFENAFFGVGALRPFIGNPTAPKGTIAFGVTAACSVLFGDPSCNDALAVPGNFIVYNTLSPGSVGKAMTAAQAMKSARYVYNDFGLANQFGIPLDQLEAFTLFKTPFGNLGRNTQFGLPSFTVNLAVAKTTRISERYKIEFRAEAANLFNRRNYGVPDAFTEDATSSFAVSSFENPGFNNGSQRQVRFGLKLIF